MRFFVEGGDRVKEAMTPWRCGRFVAATSLAFVLATGMSACTIRLVSDYDETIDRGATDYYKTMDQFLSAMARAAATHDPSGQYAPNVKFYDETGAGLSALVMRARAAEPKATCIGSEVTGKITSQLLGLKAVTAAI